MSLQASEVFFGLLVGGEPPKFRAPLRFLYGPTLPSTRVRFDGRERILGRRRRLTGALH